MNITTKQIESIKDVCKKVHSLCYTKSYRVSNFSVKNTNTGDLEVKFEVEKKENFRNDLYILSQRGTLYITPKGKQYFYNYLGNKKCLKTINSVVSPLKQKEVKSSNE